MKRKFFSLGFAPENRIGDAVELEFHEIPGCSPEDIRKAHALGKPFAGFSHLRLSEGKQLGTLPSGIILSIEANQISNPDFDVVVNCLGWKIVSNRLGNIFKTIAPNDVELLPTKITGMDGELLRSDFCVVNVLQMLDAISEQKTVRSRDKKSIFKLGVMANKVPPEVHVFRIRAWPWKFIIDDVMKKALSKHPHDGLVFNPLEQE